MFTCPCGLPGYPFQSMFTCPCGLPGYPFQSKCSPVQVAFPDIHSSQYLPVHLALPDTHSSQCSSVHVAFPDTTELKYLNNFTVLKKKSYFSQILYRCKLVTVLSRIFFCITKNLKKITQTKTKWMVSRNRRKKGCTLTSASDRPSCAFPLSEDSVRRRQLVSMLFKVGCANDDAGARSQLKGCPRTTSFFCNLQCRLFCLLKKQSYNIIQMQSKKNKCKKSFKIL